MQASQTFEARNFKKLDMHMDEFRLRLFASDVFNGSNTNFNDYVNQLKVTATNILDDLASLRCMMKLCGKPSTRWLSSDAVAARRNRRIAAGRRLITFHMEQPAVIPITSSWRHGRSTSPRSWSIPQVIPRSVKGHQGTTPYG